MIVFASVCFPLMEAKAGPVSDLVIQAQNLHAQANLIVSSPNLPQLYPSWQSQFNALTASIQAALPTANNGEYAGQIVGPLVSSGYGYGANTVQPNFVPPFPVGGSCKGGYGQACLNLQVQTGYYVLTYYQQQLASDNAMLQQIVANTSATQNYNSAQNPSP